jgi:hypothetical protein
LKPYNIADAVAMTGADATDSTVVGMRLTTTATVDITNVVAGIVDITAHGSRWVRLPPAPSLEARLQIGRFDTEAVMWSGAPIATAATELTTTLISLTMDQDASAIPHIDQHQYAKIEERPGSNSGREMRNKRLQARPAEELFGAVKSSPTVSPVNAAYRHTFWVFSVATRLIASVGRR